MGRDLALMVLSVLALGGCGSRSDAVAASPEADRQRGRLLLAQYQCGRCHTIPGVAAARGREAVTLEAFGARSYIAGVLPNDTQLLIRWIVDPPALVPDTLMPNLGVSTDDARQMAAYLDGLR